MFEPIVLANVARVDFITEEETPEAITVSTGSEATLEPVVDEGSTSTLRSKNRILARNDFEDLITGYILGLKDVVTQMKQLALVDGGTVTETGGANSLFSYRGPKTGVVLTRKPTTVDIWTEEKDGDGSTLSYVRFRVKHAKGKPVSFSFQDNEFFTPEYKMESKPKIGEEPMGMDQFLSLPSPDLTAQELLDLTNGVAEPTEPEEPQDP